MGGGRRGDRREGHKGNALEVSGVDEPQQHVDKGTDGGVLPDGLVPGGF